MKVASKTCADFQTFFPNPAKRRRLDSPAAVRLSRSGKSWQGLARWENADDSHLRIKDELLGVDQGVDQVLHGAEALGLSLKAKGLFPGGGLAGKHGHVSGVDFFVG